MRVDGHLCESWDDMEHPGDFHFVQGGLVFKCPCGCDDTLGVNFERPNEPKWTWDGNRGCPTVTPSIRRLSGCRWHGFLTAGSFTGQCE